jgi:hypothetical protein
VRLTPSDAETVCEQTVSPRTPHTSWCSHTADLLDGWDTDCYYTLSETPFAASHRNTVPMLRTTTKPL